MRCGEDLKVLTGEQVGRANDCIDNLEIFGFDQADDGLTERIRQELRQYATREPIIFELVNRVACIRYTARPQTRLKVDVNRLQALAYELSREAHVTWPSEGPPEIIVQTNVPRDKIMYCIFHELAHVYYVEIADSEQLKILDRVYEEVEEYISPEAAQNSEENFAEGFVFYFLDPIELQQTCHQMYKVLEGFFQKAK